MFLVLLVGMSACSSDYLKTEMHVFLPEVSQEQSKNNRLDFGNDPDYYPDPDLRSEADPDRKDLHFTRGVSRAKDRSITIQDPDYDHNIDFGGGLQSLTDSLSSYYYHTCMLLLEDQSITERSAWVILNYL